jgi:hypothetical protein
MAGATRPSILPSRRRSSPAYQLVREHMGRCVYTGSSAGHGPPTPADSARTHSRLVANWEVPILRYRVAFVSGLTGRTASAPATGPGDSTWPGARRDQPGRR